MPIRNVNPSVTVVGGGLAGISAACSLAEAGYQVHLIERRPYLGGRASSYEHPGTGEIIDNCQHVLIGRCTNLIDLYRRLGALDAIRWYDRFTFLTPDGQTTILESGRLPAPFHSMASFLKAPAFSTLDKIAIANGLSHFLTGLPPDSSENFGQWLRRHAQTERAIERFWKPVLVSALNEEVDRISVHYAAKVFRESFLLSPESGRMGIPAIPLSELYNRAIGYVENRGGKVWLRTSVDAITPTAGGWTVTAGEQSLHSDFVVLALSFEGAAALLPSLPRNPAAQQLAADLAQFEHSPITGIHLWLDREVTNLDHAVLLDTTIQWMFNKSRLQPAHRGTEGSYLEIVVSASRGFTLLRRQQVIDLALRELTLFFPEVAKANLLKAAVVKEVRATYSVRPLLDEIRPGSQSPWPGIFLAGDWTSTGWPATMEGAVRSGYKAAEALSRSAGELESFAAPELPATGLMRLIERLSNR